VGVIKELSLLPVAPLRLTVWVAGKVTEQADHELNSPAAFVQRLREIEDARARGELDDEQAAELEAQVIARAGGGDRLSG
jgi:hypothetical protein